MVAHWDMVAALYVSVQSAGAAAPPSNSGVADSPLLEEAVLNVPIASCHSKTVQVASIVLQQMPF